MGYGTLAQKKALDDRSRYWVTGGAVIEILAFLVFRGVFKGSMPEGSLGAIFRIVSLGGVAMWTIGWADYARSKGWSGAMGLLGIVGVGVVVLALIPDRWERALDAGDRVQVTREGTDRLVGPIRWCLLASEGLVLVVVFTPGVFGPVFFANGNGGRAGLYWALQFALWIGVCALYARRKGYSAVLGAAGLLLVPGFLLLALLPDRRARRDDEELLIPGGS